MWEIINYVSTWDDKHGTSTGGSLLIVRWTSSEGDKRNNLLPTKRHTITTSINYGS